jgi:hypothetical protein
MPHGFAFCDVAKYSMMRLEIFYHMDKGSTWRHQLFFQMLYIFVQMMLVICSINVGGFWKMEMLDWVKDFWQMNLITNVAKMFTISSNLVVENECTTFETLITIEMI